MKLNLIGNLWRRHTLVDQKAYGTGFSASTGAARVVVWRLHWEAEGGQGPSVGRVSILETIDPHRRSVQQGHT